MLNNNTKRWLCLQKGDKGEPGKDGLPGSGGTYIPVPGPPGPPVSIVSSSRSYFRFLKLVINKITRLYSRRALPAYHWKGRKANPENPVMFRLLSEVMNRWKFYFGILSFTFVFVFISGEINDPIVVPGAMTFPNKKSMINVNLIINRNTICNTTLINMHLV